MEHESLGCVVDSSIPPDKYHSLLHSLSILKKFVEFSQSLVTPFPIFLSSEFFSFPYCHFKGMKYREGEKISIKVQTAIFIQTILLFKTLNIQGAADPIFISTKVMQLSLTEASFKLRSVRGCSGCCGAEPKSLPRVDTQSPCCWEYWLLVAHRKLPLVIGTASF